jgi:predicted tellurium resistance membrane protein TerC
MSVTKRQRERLAGLLLLGLIAINYPLLALFSKTVLWFGIPALYLYLFVFWAVFIGLAAAVIEKREQSESNSKNRGTGDSV